ncbi:acyl-CoA dehydrogenase family protein [Brevibacterium sp. 50QC2O2]|uniref:acyl-CoA dehydrogenase family protein n=1 Tax=Brevibacterium TaxID=1696 RepID=UPI00211B7E38|nr:MULTISPECIES: acyl-CoA dehydrogenase family protein [unclassified Brevibacterium]MCQ9385363.1 acyl-CoA dehydrogenase family protein [Brevibacterium sp. 68QC2CO]MCQ9387241.1 acyl-CoA dehydrogenase family protein [Brevibacterium sp. 50QC2O2]
MAISFTPGMLPEEYESLRRSVADFADAEVAPVSAELDRAHAFPYELVAKMGDMGLFGLPFPEEYGGMGGDYFALCLAIEELARVNQSLAITLEAGVSLGAMPIHRFGTDAQRAELLPQVIDGRGLAAFGLTEPEAGSDAGGTRTRAVLTPGSGGQDGTPGSPTGGGTWTIDGAKCFITNSGTSITKFVTVTAVTGTRTAADGSPRPEISTLIVPSGTPGFTVEPAYDKVGWNSSDTHPLTFAGVNVPEGNLLGQRGRGYANFLRILDEGRIAVAALAVGAAQGCLDESVRYARERTAFGRPIGDYQGMSFKIARMAARTQTARAAYYAAASRMLAGLPFKTEAAIAKLVAGEAAMDNARDATQVHGGYGFMNESPVARHYRDSKVLEIGEGTTEVQLMLIGRELGL